MYQATSHPKRPITMGASNFIDLFIVFFFMPFPYPIPPLSSLLPVIVQHCDSSVVSHTVFSKHFEICA
jgi:hypothetical protein